MADENEGDQKPEGEAKHLTDLATKDEQDAEPTESTTTAEGSEATDTKAEDTKEPAKRPDWLPEKFWDTEKGEARTEALAKSYGELESKATKKSQAPKEPDGYESHIDDDTAKRLGIEDAKADPLLQFGRKFAHEAGLDQETYGKLESGFVDLLKELVPEPMDAKAEMAKLGPHGQQIVDGLVRKRDMFKTTGLFSEADEQEFNIAVGTADGARAMMKIFEFYEGRQIPQHAESTEGLPSLDDLQQQQSEAMAKGDHAALAKIRKQLDAVVGTDPTGTSRPSPLPNPRKAGKAA